MLHRAAASTVVRFLGYLLHMSSSDRGNRFWLLLLFFSPFLSFGPKLLSLVTLSHLFVIIPLIFHQKKDDSRIEPWWIRRSLKIVII